MCNAAVGCVRACVRACAAGRRDAGRGTRDTGRGTRTCRQGGGRTRTAVPACSRRATARRTVTWPGRWRARTERHVMLAGAGAGAGRRMRRIGGSGNQRALLRSWHARSDRRTGSVRGRATQQRQSPGGAALRRPAAGGARLARVRRTTRRVAVACASRHRTALHRASPSPPPTRRLRTTPEMESEISLTPDARRVTRAPVACLASPSRPSCARR